jgi:hypothetical protein
MSGAVTLGGNGISIRSVAGSTFSQYTSFIAVPYGSSAYFTWSYPQYEMSDAFPTVDINNATSWLKLGTAAMTSDSWYGATFTGPSYLDQNGTQTYNGYLGMCGIDANGNLAGVVLTPVYPTTYSAN